MENKIKALCPCCNGEVVIEYKPAKWQGEKDRIIITHRKWHQGWR